MGTYYQIRGEVTLDRAAWSALQTLPTVDWIYSDPDGDDIVVDDSAADVTVTFDGSFRGLGSCVESDVALAALIGDVSGTLSVACTDGMNRLTVTSFSSGGRIFHSSTDCLAVSSAPALQSVPNFDPESGLGPLWSFAPVLDADDRFIVSTVLPSVRWPQDCSCGGWDDHSDAPKCLGRRARPPSSDPVAGGLVRAADLEAALAGPVGDQALPPAARVVAARHGAPIPTAGLWPLRWAALLCVTDVDVAALLGDMSDEPEAAVECAALLRGLESALPPSDPASAATVDALVADAARRRLVEVIVAAARHPHLTDSAARQVVSYGEGCALAALAANPTVPDRVVLELPASVVAAAAPHRLAPADHLELVDVLGADWSGDARSMVEAIAAIVASSS